MKKILKCYPEPILSYGLSDIQTKVNISPTQHNLRYNICVAMQDNAAQHWWYSTILGANTISNIGKLAKTVHPDFFGEES